MKSTEFTGNIFLRILLTVPLRFKGVILIPLLTSLFPQELYGIWIQIILLSNLLTGLTTIRLDMALVRYIEGERDAFRTVKAIFTVTLLFGLILLCLLVVCGKPISRIVFGDVRYFSLLMPLGVWVCVGALLQIALAVFRARMKIGTLSFREFLSALWLIISVVIAWYYHLSIENLLLLCIAGDAVILVWVLQQLGLGMPISFSWVHWKLIGKYFKYSIPLVISFFLLWLANSIDRFCIVQLLGLESVAVYGVASQVSNIIVCLLNPVNYVLFPQISREWERGRSAEAFDYFSKAYGLMALLGIPSIVGICVLYQKIVILLAGPQYLVRWDLMLFLILSVILDRFCVASTYAYHLLNKTYLLPFIRGMTSLFSLTLCWLLTTRLGLLGAGLSRVLTFLFVLSFLLIWLRRDVPLRIPFGTILKATGASLMMGFVVLVCPKDTLLEVVLTAVIGALVYFILLVFMGVITLEMVFKHLSFFYREVFPVQKELSRS